jgi:phosphoribosylaminoimidazole (AIR) synthetase
VHVAGLLADRIEQDRLVDGHQIRADLIVQIRSEGFRLAGQGLLRRASGNGEGHKR